MRLKYLIITLLFCTCTVGFLKSGPIAAGYWVRLKINTEGVYRINFQDLKDAGFDISSMDPRNLKMVGHQGAMLPEINGLHQSGLPEIPIYVSGESDGKFDNGDYLLFYGGGKTKWNFNGSTQKFEHQTNIYSNDAFVYLGISAGAGKRIAPETEITQSPVRVISHYSHLYLFENDFYNPVEMGRTWLGEKLGNETLMREFDVAVPSNSKDSAYVKVVFGGAMYGADGTMVTSFNSSKQNYVFTALNPEFESFRLGQRTGWVVHGSQAIKVDLELIRSNTQCSAWLDYIEMNVLCSNIVNTPIVLRNPDYLLSGVSETRIAGTGFTIWDVSNPMLPSSITVKNGGTFEYFRLNQGNVTTALVAFQANNCLKPEIVGNVQNQDLMVGSAVDFIIISHSDFLAAANELAAFRRLTNGLSVKVVEPANIYNEYSCGMQDIVAIRDYLKDEFKKAEDSGSSLKSVLLMGSTSYDPKNRVANNTNFVPVYQSPSFIKSQTYCLDDFYTYFDSAKGVPGNSKNTMHLAVGRIPARTANEAMGVVNKLKRYASKEALGPWRSEISFVCDDVDDSWELEFINESEKYATVINKVHPDLLLNKIYTDAYKQVSTGNTEKYPDVSAAIDRTMKNGALFVNYQGHGGEKGWAQEGILSVPMINAWNNRNQMPVLFTATCEFSRYDNPGLQSGGEYALLNPNGGAIALMSTTRLVFVSGNSQINYDFWTNYGFPKPNEPLPTLGSIYQKMKNRPNITSEDNKFALLGDPSMVLAFPENHIELDSVNGKSALGFGDTLKAFSVVKMKGHIEKRLGGKFSSFNGTLWVKVFDKPQKQYTLDNDKNGSATQFTDQNSYIFKGIVSVTNGEFDIVFAIPKDISYKVDSGKIAMYAHNGVTDANGAQKLLVGGSIDQVTSDNKGPEVKLYMNDSSFVSGGVTQSDAVFIAKVFDASGINATGAGIGRDIMAVLDEDGDNTQFILNDYFNYDLNSYTRGTVVFPLTGLSVGKHKIRFKVWDIHNNSTENSIEFEVLPAVQFNITSYSAFPNPFRDGVKFRFVHNLSGENLKGTVTISDQLGRVLAKSEQNINSASSVEDRISWNGNNNNNTPVGSGFYLYRIELLAEDGRRASFSGKIIKY